MIRGLHLTFQQHMNDILTYTWGDMKVAARHGCHACVKRLLDLGMSPNETIDEMALIVWAIRFDNIGMFAEIYHHKEYRDVPYDISSIIEYNAMNIMGYMIHEFSAIDLTRIIQYDRLEMMTRLLEFRNLNIRWESLTDVLLRQASEDGAIRIMRWFMEQGANPNFSDGYGLIHTLCIGNFDVTRILLEFGADPTYISECFHKITYEGVDLLHEFHPEFVRQALDNLFFSRPAPAQFCSV